MFRKTDNLGLTIGNSSTSSLEPLQNGLSEAEMTAGSSAFHSLPKMRSHGWSTIPRQTETSKEEWDRYITRHQQGIQDGTEKEQQQPQCASSSLADLMVRAPDGHLMSSLDFFLQSGYVASPPLLSQHRKQRDAALLRHKLDKSFGDTILDAHCEQAKTLFQSDSSGISLAQVDKDFIQILGAKGAGLEVMVNTPIPRSASLCSHALLLGNRSAVIKNRGEDWRLRNIPFAPHPEFPKQSEDGYGFRFYASSPFMLSTPGQDGQDDVTVQVGRLCVMSLEAKDDFGEQEIAQLEAISSMASDLVERRWERRRATKLLRMQSSTNRLTSEFHERFLNSSSQSKDADAEERMEADVQTLLQRSCEQLVEYLEAAGSVCIGLTSRSDEMGTSDAAKNLTTEAAGTFRFETTVVGREKSTSFGALDTRNNVVNKNSLEQKKQGQELDAKVRLYASAGQTDHLPTMFSHLQEEDINSWMLQYATSKVEPLQYKSASLRRECAERYPEDNVDGEDQEADLLSSLLPDKVGTFVVVPIMAFDESHLSYCFIVYWPTEYLVEEWDCNFLKSTASIVQSACIRWHALLTERAELKIMRSVRHEMRTPLHGIIGMSTQLQQWLTSERVAQRGQVVGTNHTSKSIDLDEAMWLSRNIQYAGEDLRRLLDNLLESSSWNPENTPTSPVKGRQETSIVQLIEESCQEELLARADRAHMLNNPTKEINELSKPGASMPLVLIHADKEVKQAMFSTDATKVHNIVGQFISNAIRFTKSTEDLQGIYHLVEISICLVKLVNIDETNDKDEVIQVSILDNGIGMSGSFLQQFARPFRKVNSFRQGAGLGAALGSSMLDQLHGSLNVSSTEGKGTCVTMTFRPEQFETPSSNGRREDQALPISQGILCDFDPIRDASLLKILTNYFTPRHLTLEIEGSEDPDGVKIFFYDPTLQSSKDRLSQLCKEASAKQKLVIVSKSPKLDLDHDSTLSTTNAHIHCCLNPIGPSALQSLDSFLSQSQARKSSQKSGKHHYQKSSTQFSSEYTEHSLSPPDSIISFANEVPDARSDNDEEQIQFRSLSSVANDLTINKKKQEELSSGTPTSFSVLIVEDNPINMRLLEACVKKTHCHYQKAFNGQEAVQIFKEMAPDGPSIVLLDISLPVMDGFEACKAMRAHSASSSEEEDDVRSGEGNKRTRIVAITALSSPQDVESGLRMGMDEWRVKPANLPKLTTDLLTWQKEW